MTFPIDRLQHIEMPSPKVNVSLPLTDVTNSNGNTVSLDFKWYISSKCTTTKHQIDEGGKENKISEPFKGSDSWDSISFDDPESLSQFILQDTLSEMDSSLNKGLKFAHNEIPPLPSKGLSRGLNTNLYSMAHISPKSKFFVIKSYTEADIHAAIRHNCWSSTVLGNKRLNKAFTKTKEADVYLFFSVNGSGQFCALARMMGPVDFEKHASCWSDSKWKGSFPVKFHYICNIRNRHFKNMNVQMVRDGVQCYSSVVTSRDTQELPFDIGSQMLKIFHGFSLADALMS